MALLSLLGIKEKFTSQRWHIAKQTPDGIPQNEFRNIINTEKGIDIFQIIKVKKKTYVLLLSSLMCVKVSCENLNRNIAMLLPANHRVNGQGWI